MNNNIDPRKVNSFEFGWKLVEKLTVPHIEARSLNGLSISIQSKMAIVLGRPVTSTKRRCKECLDESHGEGFKKMKDAMQKTVNQCRKCTSALCRKHLIQLCTICVSKINEQPTVPVDE